MDFIVIYKSVYNYTSFSCDLSFENFKNTIWIFNARIYIRSMQITFYHYLSRWSCWPWDDWKGNQIHFVQNLVWLCVLKLLSRYKVCISCLYFSTLWTSLFLQYCLRVCRNVYHSNGVTIVKGGCNAWKDVLQLASQHIP